MVHLNDELAKAIFGKDGSKKYKEYEAALAIREQTQKIKYRVDTAVEEYEKLLAALGSQQLALQEKCQHQVVTFIPDPSGNNDSERRCELCGKSV